MYIKSMNVLYITTVSRESKWSDLWTVVHSIKLLWNIWQVSWSHIKLTEFLNLVTVNILGQINLFKKSFKFILSFPPLVQTILYCGFCPLNCRRFKHISGLYPLYTNVHPVVSTKNISRHWQITPGWQRVRSEIAPTWETTGLIDGTGSGPEFPEVDSSFFYRLHDSATLALTDEIRRLLWLQQEEPEEGRPIWKSINGWMSKQNVIQPYDEIVFILKKEWSSNSY